MPPHTSLIFDVETRADTDLISRLGYVAKEGAFLPPLFHLPCAIAVGHVTGEGVLTSVESLGGDLLGQDDPCVLTEDFWAMAEHAPVLISYNGRAFDIPVLELCALRYGVVAPKHWGAGRENTRYRYGTAHLDLLDILSNYGGATKGLTLSHVVQLLGYQGKDGLDGSMVQGLYDEGHLDTIREYNRGDVVMTYAVWLHYALVAGRLTRVLFEQAQEASTPWLDRLRLVHGR